MAITTKIAESTWNSNQSQLELGLVNPPIYSNGTGTNAYPGAINIPRTEGFKRVELGSGRSLTLRDEVHALAISPGELASLVFRLWEQLSTWQHALGPEGDEALKDAVMLLKRMQVVVHRDEQRF